MSARKAAKSTLDTSVLVKPSQIHPEREKYVKILEKLRDEESNTNRLGVPVMRNVLPKNHHKKNLDHLKKVFRDKHTLMPYKHEELKKSPIERLDEDGKVGFDLKRLP